MKKLKHDKCTVLASSNLIFFDIDDTLILWDTVFITEFELEAEGEAELVGGVVIKDPHIFDKWFVFTPHRAHCNILRRNFAQGRQIVVWSAAGHLWAHAVITALGLDRYVTLIMDKPTIIVDDIPMEHWNPKTVYLKHDTEA